MATELPALGKYQLIRKLATGGMAEVYLAKVAGPGGFEKTVVVKRILPHLAEEENFVAMFLGEARLAAQLNHPNVVQVFDFGEADGQYYLVMEYLDGPNFRFLLRKAAEKGDALPVSHVAKLISGACEGLAYAHEYVDPQTGESFNLVHRDISPDNVIVARNGSVKVVDFGIAKAATSSNLTKTGTVKGKFAYMPPEQLRGEVLDKRADIFALGVVLYELLTGKKPFDTANEAVIVRAILYEPMLPAAQFRPDLPEGMQRILDIALQKDAKDRYPDMRAFQSDLERFVVANGEPVSQFHLSQLVQKYHNPVSPSAPQPHQATPQSNPSAPRAATPVSTNAPPPPPAPPPAPPAGDFSVVMTTSTVEKPAPPVAAEPPPPVALDPVHLRPRARVDPVGPTLDTLDPVRPAPQVEEKRSSTFLIAGIAAALLGFLAVGGIVAVSKTSSTVTPPPPAPVVAVRPPAAPPEPTAPPPAPVEPAKVEEPPAAPPVAVVPPPAAPVEPVVVPAPPVEPPRPPPVEPTRAAEPVKVARADPPRHLRAPPVKPAVEPARPAPEPVKAPEPVAVAAAVVESGTLEFRVRPFGSVWVDDKFLGDTPFAPARLTAGPHKVRVVCKDPPKEVTRTFEVKAGANIFRHNFEE